MQLPEYGCQFSCERKSGNKLHMKGKYHVRRVAGPSSGSSWQIMLVHESYLQDTHTYTTDAMHMLLDHTLLGHVGGGKWPGDEAKPCHVLKSVLTVALYTPLVAIT